MELSPMTILIGLVPVLGIGAGYLFLGPLKNMFKSAGKAKKHKLAQKEGEAKVLALSDKSSELVVKVENIEKAATETKEKIKQEVIESKKRVDAIIKSDKNLSELTTEFDEEW